MRRRLELLPVVVAGFLRLVTNRRVFPDPSPIKDAVGFVDAIVATPGVEIPEGGREWQTLRRLCLKRNCQATTFPTLG